MKVEWDWLRAQAAPVRIVVFLLTLVGLWAPAGIAIGLWVKNPNQASILSIPLLYGIFLILIPIWGQGVHRQREMLRHYGLRRPAWREWLAGTCLGLGSIALLFAIEGQWGWLRWTQIVDFRALALTTGEGLLVGSLFGFAEELLFRGWLLDELWRDYGMPVAGWVSAIIFAIAHFIKPIEVIVQTWLTFPALMVLGVGLFWAKRSTDGRLGLSMGVHGGLVGGYYILNVGKLVEPVIATPAWLTGVGDNPLASVPGITALIILGLLLRLMSKFRTQ